MRLNRSMQVTGQPNLRQHAGPVPEQPPGQCLLRPTPYLPEKPERSLCGETDRQNWTRRAACAAGDRNPTSTWPDDVNTYPKCRQSATLLP
jgi:hypothetical protein